jgi:hypothetical protein
MNAITICSATGESRTSTVGIVMSANHRRPATGRLDRSEAQRQGSAAMIQVMQAWEALGDEQRLAWVVEGSRRRVKAG